MQTSARARLLKEVASSDDMESDAALRSMSDMFSCFTEVAHQAPQMHEFRGSLETRCLDVKKPVAGDASSTLE